MDFDGRVCVVTGGASGIGAASCRAFAARGARVAVVDINAAGAAALAGEVSGHGFGCDIGNEAEVNRMIGEVEDTLGEIDLFFHNAGIATGGDPISTPVDVWQSQWNINVMSHVFAIRVLLPKMLERGEGYFIHTASMAGILSSHGNLPYATTKHAVVGLAEWMAFTYHDRGIRTSLLAPLGVNTPMLAELSGISREAAGPVKEAEEVAGMVANAVEKETFLILSDPIAQTWMEGKTRDVDRWLAGMRRLQATL